jgi:hypothetical protein
MCRFGSKRARNECDAPDNGIGVYEITCVKPINRAFGVDTKGVLYIGRSKLLGKRIRHFWSCADGSTKSGHPAGRKYRKLRYGWRKKYGLNNIRIRWRIHTSVNDAMQSEKKLIAMYVEKFGETPPLNDATG